MHADPGFGGFRDGFHGTGALGLFFWLGSAHPAGTIVAVLLLAWLGFQYGDQLSWPVRALPGFLSGRGGGTGLEAELPNVRDDALRRLRARDPAFDEAEFSERAVRVFRAFQDAWEREDIGLARAFVSDGVNERFRRRVDELRERGLRRRVSGMEGPSAEILGCFSGERFDSLYVGFTAEAADRLVRGDGAVESGGRGKRKEVWTFLRRPGARTLSRPGPLEGRCPVCGAPLEISDAARCVPCGAWVNSGEFDWVAVGMTAESEWAFPRPDREIGGWRRLRESDPGISLEGLQDRAAVAFWRWLDACRRADPAPLRGLASETFLRDLSLGEEFSRDAEIGLVELTACEARVGFDRVHVQVRWKGERMRRAGTEAQCVGYDDRTDFLVFHRRAGTLSDAREGLRSARCRSCGAPFAEADAACAYCGAALGDGTVWTLDGVIPYGDWRRPAVDGAADLG